jgi:hypothetical protein
MVKVMYVFLVGVVVGVSLPKICMVLQNATFEILESFDEVVTEFEMQSRE